MIDQSLAQPAPTTTTRELRGLKLFEERGEGIEMIAPEFYLCPSKDGERFYHVDYALESCDCLDHVYRGVACVHIYAVGIKLAKRRAKTACDGCGGRFPLREMMEAMEDDLGVFEGERFCRPCTTRVGVR